MKPYPKYKDSGIEWIGEIPEHWKSIPLKHVAGIVLGKMLTPEDKGGYVQKPYLRAQNIQWETVDISDVKEMWFSEDELERYRVSKGDVLISEGGEVGRTALWKDDLSECYIQNSVHKVTVNPGNSYRFFLYHCVVFGKTGYFDSMVSRVSIAHLTKDKLRQIKFFIPSLSEQHSIASYLDRKTRQIDALIEKKRKQVDLLREQRTAVINEAVTKGLNPKVKMKDSGVEWIGEIPEHWDAYDLKRLSRRIDVGIAEAATHAYRDTGVPIIRSTNLKGGIISLDDLIFISPEFAESHAAKRLFQGDLLTVRTGNAGVTAVVPPSLDHAQCFTMLMTTLNDKQCPSFFCYFLNTVAQSYFDISSWGTAQKNISVPILGACPVPALPLIEQKAIVTYLDKKTSSFDTMLTKETTLISLLQEYRTSLISEVVTGKMDVRSETAA